MTCKFCFAELEENAAVCPVCGKSLTEETAEAVEPTETVETAEAVEPTEGVETAETVEPTETVEETETTDTGKKVKTWKVVLVAVGCFVLLLALVCAVLYGLGVDLRPRENDVYCKDSYTVKDANAEKKADDIVATLGDMTLTNGELQAYYWINVYDFLSYYGNYLSMMGFDASKPLDEQVYDEKTGMTFQQMFLSNALENWNTYATLVSMSKDANFTLTAEQQAQLDAFKEGLQEAAKEEKYEDLELFIDEKFFPGSSVAAYINYNVVNFTALSYYDSLVESLLPTQAEIEAYYTEHEAEFKEKKFSKDDGNYYDVRHILITPTGGTTDEDGVTVYTDAEWEACRASAQLVLDGYLAGDNSEETFAKLAKQKSQDPGSAANGGLYTELTKDTNFVESFKNWYLDESRKVGDTGLVKSEHGYHVMYFSGSKVIWEYEAESALMTERTGKMLDDAMVKYPMEINYKKIVLGEVSLVEESAS